MPPIPDGVGWVIQESKVGPVPAMSGAAVAAMQPEPPPIAPHAALLHRHFAGGTCAFAAGTVDPGKREYESSCTACHGLDGKGRGSFSEGHRPIRRRMNAVPPAAERKWR